MSATPPASTPESTPPAGDAEPHPDVAMATCPDGCVEPENAPEPLPPRWGREHLMLIVAMGIIYVVWGSTYLGIRVVVAEMPPLLSAGLRFLCGALIMGVLVHLRRPGSLRITAKQLRNCAIVGCLLLLCGNGLVSIAETPQYGVSSGIAALLVALVPLIVVILRAGTGDRPAPVTVAGIVLGLGGLAVLVLPGSQGSAPLVGSAMIFTGATCWAVGSFFAGRADMPSSPLVSSVYQMLCGALGQLAVAGVHGEWAQFTPTQYSPQAWWALVYLLVAGSVIAFSAYAWLLQRAPVSLVSTYAYVNPVIAVMLGWAILSEPLTAQVALGGAIIVAGVALVIRTERRGRSSKASARP